MHLRRSVSLLAAGAIALAPLSLIAPSFAADASPPTLSLDPEDVTYTIDPAPHFDVPPPTTPKTSPGATASQAGLAVPVLNSRPSSAHTIYLDFDGVTLETTGVGSAWTTGTTHIDPGTYTGFTLDGSADFNQAEIDQITKIWKIVSEKYSPYDVNVTTVDPGAEGLRRTNASDSTYGIQVVFTDDASPRSQICGSCAGISYNDLYDGRQQNTTGGGMTAFDSQPYALNWVFTSATFGSAQVSAVDASHEIGHAMGLKHDGDATHPDYYPGHANWVPIMGITNQNAVSQFSKGEYTGANNTQDDLAIIGTNGDAGTAASFTRQDDFTTSSGAPTGAAVLGDQTSYTVDGIITDATDDDLFSITRTCTTPLVATSTGIGAGQSLDIRLEIQNAAGTVLQSNDPASGQTYVNASVAYEPTGMDATATVASPTAGGTVYRIKVDGVGSGNPLNTGYSDYGSVGQYHLTITGCPSGTPPTAPQSASYSGGFRNNSAEIDWTAPSSEGSSPVTGYQITGLPGGTVELGNVLTYDAFNFNPGQTYPVTIKARNASGLSAGKDLSVRINTWAPTTKPGLTANLAGGTATVSWTAPANPGNGVLTGWHVVGSGATTIDETVPAATLTKNYSVAVGTTSFTVTGVYTADIAGAVASDSQSVVRAAGPTAPDAPATASGTQNARTNTATLTWTAPTSNGGSAVTGYRIGGLPGGTNELLGNVLTYTATGLTPGTTYHFTVEAMNAIGTGAATTVDVTVTTWAPTTKPGLTVSRSGTTATLRWTAPTNNGGATLTQWTVTRTGPGSGTSKSFTAGTTQATWSGLAVGTHSFRVKATYLAADTGGVVASDPKSVTVTTKPGAPRIGTATSGATGGSATATARWSAPTSTGGSAITKYRVYAYKMVNGKITRTVVSKLLVASARSYAFPLAVGKYKFRVVAVNAVGTSAFSGYSAVVTSR